MTRRPAIRPALRPILRPVLGAIGNRRPTALTISQLLPSGAGRVAAIYSDPARPSYDECIQKNMAAIAAGRPQDCVLFSDAAGQMPVVYPIGAGQGKGLLLDRSAGLLLGPELVVNGDFSDGTTGWTASGSATINAVAGSMEVVRATTGSYPSGNQTLNGLVIGRMYQIECDFTNPNALEVYLGFGGYTNVPRSFSTAGKLRAILTATATTHTLVAGLWNFSGAVGQAVTFDNISVREIPGHHQRQPTAAARGEFSRRYNLLTATATLSTQSITAIATQYRLYFTGAGTVTLSGAATGVYSAGSHLITCTAGSLTLTVAGSVLTADLRFEADATIGLPEYQRVTTASDYDEVGFPTYWRAQTDDWAKSHMNPNGATKSYVFWAGQKMSDAATFVNVESSPDASSTDGAVGQFFSTSNTPNGYGTLSRGSLLASVSGVGAPVTARAVVVSNGNIPDDVASININGTTTTSATDQGTGTYTEQDVFFGARAGTSLFANIREYAPPTILFLQPADSLSASHLSKLQRAYAKAAGVTL